MNERKLYIKFGTFYILNFNILSKQFLQNKILEIVYEAGIYFGQKHTGYITSALPLTHPACNTISLK